MTLYPNQLDVEKRETLRIDRRIVPVDMDAFDNQWETKEKMVGDAGLEPTDEDENH